MKMFKDTFPILTSCSECNHTSASASSRKQHNRVILSVFAVFSTPHTTTITTTTRSTIRHPATNPAVGLGHTMGWGEGRQDLPLLSPGAQPCWQKFEHQPHQQSAGYTTSTKPSHEYTVICIKASLALVKNQPRKGKNTPRSAQSAWFQVNILVSWCCW